MTLPAAWARDKRVSMSFRTPCAMLGHVVSQVLRGVHDDETH